MVSCKTKSKEGYAMAEWILSPTSAKIVGVRLAAKSATSTTPFVRICPLDPKTCTQSGEVISVSNGGLLSYLPINPYILPPTVRYGPTLGNFKARDTKVHVKSHTTNAKTMKLIMNSVDEQPFKVNPDMASTECDRFVGKVDFLIHSFHSLIFSIG